MLILTQTRGVDFDIPLTKGQTIPLIFGCRVSPLCFDILFFLWMCNDNIDSDSWGRFRNSVDEGPNFVYLKTGFLQYCRIFRSYGEYANSAYLAIGRSNKFWGPISTA